MKKELLILFFALFTLLLNGQNKIKGQLIDPYGEIGFAEININNGIKQFDFDSGKFEIESVKNKIVEIEFILPGYFKLKYIVECKNKITDLGKIYLIENNNWLDGPKSGYIREHYDSGIIENKRRIRNWKLHGISEFYNKDGELNQKILFKRNRPIKIYIRENEKMKELKFEFDKKTEIITVPNTA